MFRAVTVAPGITEPLESDTVPRMLPIAPCAAGYESTNATRSVVHATNERTKRCFRISCMWISSLRDRPETCLSVVLRECTGRIGQRRSQEAGWQNQNVLSHGASRRCVFESSNFI